LSERRKVDSAERRKDKMTERNARIIAFKEE